MQLVALPAQVAQVLLQASHWFVAVLAQVPAGQVVRQVEPLRKRPLSHVVQLDALPPEQVPQVASQLSHVFAALFGQVFEGQLTTQLVPLR